MATRKKFVPKGKVVQAKKSIATPDAVNTKTAERIPKSFVLKAGDLSKLAARLLVDLRHVMEPNTASRLVQRKKNRMRDFISMAGPLGVTHLLLLSQSAQGTNLRVGCIPQGPTLHFAIQTYTLASEIFSVGQSQKTTRRGRAPSAADFTTPPLIVLNNFPVERAEGRLMSSMLQNMFPTINTETVRLSDVRRVVVFSYEQREPSDHVDGDSDDEDEDGDSHGDGVVHFRHYVVGVKLVGMSKTVKRIIRAEIPNLSQFADAADYLLHTEANMSDSEVEPDSLVDFADTKKPQRPANAQQSVISKSQHQKAISLVECGPRMTLRLMKITEGLNGGRILYHHLGLKKSHEHSEADPDEEDVSLEE